MDIFLNPTLWVGVAFVLFVVLVGRNLYKMVGSMLDQRIARVKSTISEAENLRQQAEKILKEYQEKFGQAEYEAREMVLRAQAEAELLKEQSFKNLELTLERRQRDAITKMEQAQQQLLQQTKTEIAHMATHAVYALLSEKMTAKLDEQLFEHSLEEVQSQIKV